MSLTVHRTKIDDIDLPAMLSVLLECLAAGIHADMESKGAGNYAAFQLSDGNGNRFMALFTKLPDGKTPMELHAEAQAEVKRLRAAIERALADEESGTGWGPDVTVCGYLREALSATPTAKESES